MTEENSRNLSPRDICSRIVTQFYVIEEGWALQQGFVQ